MILAVNPDIAPILPVLSLGVVGGLIRTVGATVYPKPAFVITDPVIAPPETDRVAVAVVPTPTPILGGALIDTVGADE